MSFACFVLELVGFDFSKKNIILCSFAAFDKNRQQLTSKVSMSWVVKSLTN